MACVLTRTQSRDVYSSHALPANLPVARETTKHVRPLPTGSRLRHVAQTSRNSGVRSLHSTALGNVSPASRKRAVRTDGRWRRGFVQSSAGPSTSLGNADAKPAARLEDLLKETMPSRVICSELDPVRTGTTRTGVALPLPFPVISITLTSLTASLYVVRAASSGRKKELVVQMRRARGETLEHTLETLRGAMI